MTSLLSLVPRALRRSLRLALYLGSVLACPASLAAQTPRISPPPPCRVSPAIGDSLVHFGGVYARRARGATLAILPFEREIEDATKLYMEWALRNRLEQILSQNEKLRVITSGSVARAVMETGGSRYPVARLLGAQYVLTGSLMIARGQQSVSMALYRLGNANPVWRASFGERWTLQRLQRVVAAAVARAILGDVEASDPPPLGAMADAAYDAVAAGDFALLSPGLDAADSARAAYERALTIDPSSGIAAARVAKAYAVILDRGGNVPGSDRSSTLSRIMLLTAQALTADPKLAEAWTVRAMHARLRDPLHFTGALAAHSRAVLLAPNDADAQHEFGITLLRLGDHRGAESHLRRALALEPNRAPTLAAMGEIALLGDRWSEACAYSNASVAAWPYDPIPYAVRSRARLHLTQTRDAYSDAETAARLTNALWVRALHVLIEAGSTNEDAARQQAMVLATIALRPGMTLSPRDASYTAMAFEAVGDRRRAVEALRRARPLGAELVASLRDPQLEPLRGDTAVVRLSAEATKPAPKQN